MDLESSIYVLSNIVHYFINVVSEEARSVPDSFGKNVIIVTKESIILRV